MWPVVSFTPIFISLTNAVAYLTANYAICVGGIRKLKYFAASTPLQWDTDTFFTEVSSYVRYGSSFNGGQFFKRQGIIRLPLQNCLPPVGVDS